MDATARAVLNPFRRIAHLERALLDLLDNAGFAITFVPTFSPLAHYAERVGDELQSAYITLALEGEHVLRPEFTTSICRLVLDTPELRAHTGALRLSYAGQTFRVHRQPSLFPHERRQVGGELFGSDPGEGDAEVLRLVGRLLAATGARGFSVHLGHAELLDRALGALAATAAHVERVRRDLRRATGHAMRFAARDDVLREILPRLLAARGERAGDPNAAAAARECTDDPTGALLLALERRIVRTEWERSGLPAPAIRFLDDLPRACGSLAHVRAWLEDAGCLAGVRGILDTLEALCDSESGSRAGCLTMVIDPTIVRGISYYSGLLFDVRDPSGVGVGGGGRYDRLMALLGDDSPGRTAIGFALDVGHLAELAPDEA